MNPLACEVIQDLLPLYYDDVCSPATKETVEDHIATCAACQAILDKMKTPIDLPLEIMEKNKSEGNGLRGIQVFWNRSRATAFAKGLLAATIGCAALFLGYIALFEWNITKVPGDVIKITDVSRLRDGKIAYHVKMTDGYNVNQINYNADEEGNLYMTPVRPLIKSKKFADIGLANRYDFIDLEQVKDNQKKGSPEIRAVYYGSPGDPVLIWKQGMELTAASDAIEAQFDNRD